MSNPSNPSNPSNISILGCGWLGAPLAEHLVRSGHSVRGSTTSPEKLDRLRELGVEPYLIKLDPELRCEECAAFWESDALVLNIPPGRGDDEVTSYFPAQVESVIAALRDSSVNRVIFASSTSVYPPGGGVVEEGDARRGHASRPSGEALLKAERMLLKEDGFRTTVLRFGGLYGPDRHPARYLAGRGGLDRGNAPVNLIHLDDCIAIIDVLLRHEDPPEVLNAVSDGHPPRKLYYPQAAEKMGLDPPVFNEDSHSDYNIVSNRNLKELLGYTFAHPDPMH